MKLNCSHNVLPKLFFILSIILNSLLIYCIRTDVRITLGRYKILLLTFAIFNMVYSLVEIIVPMGIHGTHQIFVVFLSSGPFHKSLRWGQLVLSIRCGFIFMSYGVLTLHFVYRYLVIFNPRVICGMSNRFGIIFIVIFLIAHCAFWTAACELLLYATDEGRGFVAESFREVYNHTSYNIPMLWAIYKNGSVGSMTRSWVGIVILTAVQVLSIVLYIALGTKILVALANKSFTQCVQKYHKTLLKALIIQASIPICISFAPCLLAWYCPVFGYDSGQWNNYFGVVALSAFPALDPIVVIIMLSNYRERALSISKKMISICKH